MRFGLRFLFFLAPVTALAIFGSLFVMERLGRQWVVGDPERRSRLISESMQDHLVDSLESKRHAAVEKLLNRISRDERMVGALVCSGSGALIAKSDAVPQGIGCGNPTRAGEESEPRFTRAGNLDLHHATFRIEGEQGPLGYLVLIHDTSYMSRRHEITKRYIVSLLAGISALFFVITLLIYRLSMSAAVNRLKAVMKGLITGETTRIDRSLTRSEFSPLVKDLPKDVKLGIGVDRVDYTKGIVERMRSVERFLDRNPEYVGKFVFVQIGAPSRTHIKKYQDLNAEVQEVAVQINWKFHRAEVPPILLKLQHHNSPELFRYFRAANVCFVSSLHDGMSLVAKEYVSARGDLDGTLILSNFAGASRELTDALLVNPYDVDECAQALRAALTMPEPERRLRMERMRKIVSERNVYRWAGSFLSEIDRIAREKAPHDRFQLQGWYG